MHFNVHFSVNLLGKNAPDLFSYETLFDCSEVRSVEEHCDSVQLAVLEMHRLAIALIREPRSHHLRIDRAVSLAHAFFRLKRRITPEKASESREGQATRAGTAQFSIADVQTFRIINYTIYSVW